jgi:AraC-like DNA-binding protein
MRTVKIGSQPVRTIRNLFANLGELESVEVIASDSERRTEAARVRIDRTEGHGSSELYRLDSDLYVIVIDTMFDDTREEIVPGEGLIEIHVCLRGTFSIRYPGEARPLVVKGPCLLIQNHNVGIEAVERLEAGTRVTGVSLYLRQEYLAKLLSRNGIVDAGALSGIDQHRPGRVWYRKTELPCSINYAATSLLQSSFRGGLRLLHAESKALEIICEVLNLAVGTSEASVISSVANEARQLDQARHIMCTSFSPVPSISDVSRAVGMSASKLKRKFQARFGKTIFECGLEARMLRAFELLKSNQMSICQVAHAVGYRHQTSFTGAFRRHFGVAPRVARHPD